MVDGEFEKQITCEDCDESFRSEEAFDAHECDTWGPRRCVGCGDRFSEWADYQAHLPCGNLVCK